MGLCADLPLMSKQVRYSKTYDTIYVMCVHIFIYGFICTTKDIVMTLQRPQIFCIQVKVSIPCGLRICVKLPCGKKIF